MTEPVLELKNLCLTFGAKDILKNISLKIARGELVGLVGGAGSGKSSLLKIIAGLYKLTGGTLTYNLPPRQQEIGMSFQNNALFDFLNVAENVAFPLRQKRCFSEEEIAERTQKILAAVDLAAFGNYAPKDLSGGMQRRVGIARAMVLNPLITLFDDPSAGLDPVTSMRIFKLIADYAAKNLAAAIVVSSDVVTLCTIVKRVIWLENGQIVFDGPPEKIDVNQI